MAQNKVVEIEVTRGHFTGRIEISFTRSDGTVREHEPKPTQLNDIEHFLNHDDTNLHVTLLQPGLLWLRADVEMLAGRLLSEE